MKLLRPISRLGLAIRYFLLASAIYSPALCSPLVAEDIFADGGAVRIEGSVAFVEGPAWHASGNVYFTDPGNNRIMRRDPKGVLHVFRQPSGGANGLVFDGQGRLIACEGAGEGGNRRVTRTELDGTITVLADKFAGHRFNSPNDVTIDADGRIYFTDPRYGPRYGPRDDIEQLDAAGKPIEGVYRIDPDGSVARVIAGEVERPNGLATSPDGKWLYVVDNQNSTRDGNRKLWRFALDDGAVDLKSRKLLHDFGRGRGGDGMEVDSEGRLYVAAGYNVANEPLESADVAAGVYVFTPEGKQAGFVPIKMDMVTNCCFGGADGKTLFITAGHTLWSVRVTTPGFHVWPKFETPQRSPANECAPSTETATEAATEPATEPATEAANVRTELVAMTFNIRYDNRGDGKNAWPHRRDDVGKLIARERPDVVGMQEALSGQIDDLKERLADYDWYGVGRDDGQAKGEAVPIFYRRDRFDVLDKGTFWLSETPDEVGSKGWDAALPRIASWLRLRDKKTGKALLFANVHFDHRGPKARLESARLLRRKLLEIAGELPIVLVGDFNASPDSPPYKAMIETAASEKAADDAADAENDKASAVLRDARGLVEKPAGPNTTWNGFEKAVAGNRIDHVFVDRHWTVSAFRVIDEKTDDGRFYSDHFPIVAKLRVAAE
ncbi:MAG: SMP-30/gluconolactonase/LRE family protein [Pirellulales bacterium]